MENLTSLETKLAAALTNRGFKDFTKGQLEFITNLDSELTNGKTFNQVFNPQYFIVDMVGLYIDMMNKNKFESDFRNL
tara:strand:+ start:871 stop:1104 length:234 start_codon:yes stop_codon:yes gene_type:complete